jgi:hypothetical protein
VWVESSYYQLDNDTLTVSHCASLMNCALWLIMHSSTRSLWCKCDQQGVDSREVVAGGKCPTFRQMYRRPRPSASDVQNPVWNLLIRMNDGWNSNSPHFYFVCSFYVCFNKYWVAAKKTFQQDFKLLMGLILKSIDMPIKHWKRNPLIRCKKKKNSLALIRKRTIPTERPPLSAK